MADYSVTHTDTWDETKPAGTRARSLGDDDIREFKRAIRERLAVDHQFEDDETGISLIGTHKLITFTETQAVNPTTYDDTGYLYIKTVSGQKELFWKDSAGNVLQLTTDGYIGASQILLENNTYLKSKDAAGTGTVNLIKADANDVPVLGAGAETATDDAPTSDKDVANKKYVDDQIASWAVGDHIGIGHGVVAAGATIPLPSGFTEEQCKWMVSVGNISATDSQAKGLKLIDFVANGTRTVTADITTRNWVDSASEHSFTGVANYIIIGIK